MQQYLQQFVFITHSSEDKPRFRPLVDALIDAGIKVWIDPIKLRYTADEVKQHFAGSLHATGCFH